MEGTSALPSTRYAKSGNVHVAYQIFGEGEIDLVFFPGFVSNIETYWEEPSFAHWLNKLASLARVVTFDKRGTGLSDRVESLPTMDERMDDVRAVMDAARPQKAAVFGLLLLTQSGHRVAGSPRSDTPFQCAGLSRYDARS